MPLRRPLPAVLCCAAVALTGCGGSSLLDGDSASELQTSLSNVRAAIDEGSCSEARSAATAGAKRVDELPSSVDADLRDRLRTGFQELSDRVGTDCEPAATTTTTDTTTTDTTTTDVAPVEPTSPTTTEDAPTTTDAPDTTTPDTPSTGPGSPGGGPDGGPGGGADDDGGDDSGGVVPGVDGPGASERSRGQGPKADKALKERLKDLRQRAKKYFEGQGGG